MNLEYRLLETACKDGNGLELSRVRSQRVRANAGLRAICRCKGEGKNLATRALKLARLEQKLAAIKVYPHDE